MMAKLTRSEYGCCCDQCRRPFFWLFSVAKTADDLSARRNVETFPSSTFVLSKEKKGIGPSRERSNERNLRDGSVASALHLGGQIFSYCRRMYLCSKKANRGNAEGRVSFHFHFHVMYSI